MKKYWKIILLVVVLVGGIGLYFGMKEYNRGAADVSSVKTDIVIKSDELTIAYGENESKADSLYNGKTLEVTGIVKGIEKDEKGLNTIILAGDSELSNVTCQMDERHNEEAKDELVGKTITIKGNCTGVLMDVVLIRCAVDK